MRATGERGSSIIESLAAMAVILVGILGLAVLTGALVRSNRKSDQIGLAAFAAGEKMERLLADAPLNLDGDLSIGSHPPDQSNSARYEALDANGAVVASSAPAGASGAVLLRRWLVSSESSPRCLRRVDVKVWSSSAIVRLAEATSYANCP